MAVIIPVQSYMSVLGYKSLYIVCKNNYILNTITYFLFKKAERCFALCFLFMDDSYATTHTTKTSNLIR